MKHKVVKRIFKVLSLILVFAIINIFTLYFGIVLLTHGPSINARNLFTTTMLETGALKWVVGLVLDKNTVNGIVESNSMSKMDLEVNSELIDITNENIDNKNDIEIIPITGNNFYATLMIVHDPKRLSVESTYPFSKDGMTIEELVNKSDSIGGVNGGLFLQDSGHGGTPMGVVVSKGKIVWNKAYGNGFVLVGFDTNNILKIISLAGMNSSQVANLVKSENIRDAVTFQEEASDVNNHFVKLIVNGEVRELNGKGSGANPRTVIGQREDGAVLLLVTDGRGAGGHLGATASDLISIMKDYKAVNAANIDGGSSSCMYYNNEYLMTSTTLYYSNASYKLPDGFVVSK